MKNLLLDRFRDIVTGHDENINVAEAALIIANNENPVLDPARCVQRLDGMAEEFRIRRGGIPTIDRIVPELNRYLFDELGFRGNIDHFNDPRNSYLDQVLDRRLGIPISLSLIYMEVGRRLGLPVDGISFPGHFLVRVGIGREGMVLDPFSAGIELDREELQRRLENAVGGRRASPDLDELLQPASNREILSRMLRNLKNIYFEREDYRRALDCVNFALAIAPGTAAEIRDRAYIHDQLEHIRAAIRDYEEYLMLSPDTDDTRLIRHRLADLKQSALRLH